MEKNWLDENQVPLRDVVREFERRHPRIDHVHGKGLDGRTMRKILVGDLVIVHISGRRKFTLMDRDYIDSGKLAEHNAKVREYNRRIRQARKAQKAQALAEALKDPGFKDLYDLVTDISERINQRNFRR